MVKRTTVTSSSGGEESTGVDSVSEDDLCPVCRLLLCHPVTTICNHTLCESCMATWAEVSVASQMQIIDVDADQDSTAFDAVSGLEARCPMCRTQTTATLDRLRERKLRQQYPSTYTARLAEEHATTVNGDGDEIQTMTLYIGNRHSLVSASEGSENQHDWTFFIRPSRTDVVEEVHITLHPTFRPRRVIRSRQPYEVRRLGWGYFTITAQVMLKPGYSWMSEDAEDSPDGAEKGMLGLEWMLDFTSFEGRGSQGRLRLKIKNQRAWQGVGEERKEDERAWERVVRQYERDGLYVPRDEA